MSSKRVFIIIVFFELIAIFVFLFTIFQKKLGKKSVSPIKKDSVLSYSTKSLKLFWEPPPNGTDNLSVNPQSSKVKPYFITTNNDSLNERFDYSLEKDPKTYRIITLGDSFTYGIYTDTKANWVELLEDKLNRNCINNSSIKKFEVINLGVWGYDIQYSLERFKLRGLKYNPDLVLWFLKDDDFRELNEVMIEKEKYYSQLLKKTGEYQKLVDKGDAYPSWTMATEETYREMGGEDKFLKLQVSYIDELISIYKNKLLLFTFPNTSKIYKDIMIKLSREDKRIFFTDKITNINDFKNLQLENDPHPNNEGHKVISQDLFNYLKNDRIIPCD